MKRIFYEIWEYDSPQSKGQCIARCNGEYLAEALKRAADAEWYDCGFQYRVKEVARTRL